MLNYTCIVLEVCMCISFHSESQPSAFKHECEIAEELEECRSSGKTSKGLKNHTTDALTEY